MQEQEFNKLKEKYGRAVAEGFREHHDGKIMREAKKDYLNHLKNQYGAVIEKSGNDGGLFVYDWRTENKLIRVY